MGSSTRRRLSALVSAAFAITFLFGLDAPPAQASRASEVAEPAPPELVADLQKMDDDLRRMLGAWRRGAIGGWGLDEREEHTKFIDRVHEIADQKRRIVRTYFDGPALEGVGWGTIFEQLDCIDYRLGLALGYDLIPDRAGLGYTNRRRAHVPDFIDRARQCRRALEDDLRRTGASGPFLTDLERMDDDLRRMSADWKRGKIGGWGASEQEQHKRFRDRVDQIHDQKLRIVATYFNGPTYESVDRLKVFRTLDCVDAKLGQAIGWDLIPDNFLPSYRPHVADFIEHAERCKKQLERALG